MLKVCLSCEGTRRDIVSKTTKSLRKDCALKYSNNIRYYQLNWLVKFYTIEECHNAGHTTVNIPKDVTQSTTDRMCDVLHCNIGILSENI
jgi:hypothetical protein